MTTITETRTEPDAPDEAVVEYDPAKIQAAVDAWVQARQGQA